MELLDEANQRLRAKGYEPDEMRVEGLADGRARVVGQLVPQGVSETVGGMLWLLDFLPQRDEFVEWQQLAETDERFPPA
jgi:hypothetical protein